MLHYHKRKKNDGRSIKVTLEIIFHFTSERFQKALSRSISVAYSLLVWLNFNFRHFNVFSEKFIFKVIFIHEKLKSTDINFFFCLFSHIWVFSMNGTKILQKSPFTIYKIINDTIKVYILFLVIRT